MKFFAEIQFPSGHSVVIDQISNGQVYFRRWYAGVESQGFLENLVRMPIPVFEKALLNELGREGVRAINQKGSAS